MVLVHSHRTMESNMKEIGNSMYSMVSEWKSGTMAPYFQVNLRKDSSKGKEHSSGKTGHSTPVTSKRIKSKVLVSITGATVDLIPVLGRIT